jgi:hypothetical protein
MQIGPLPHSLPGEVPFRKGCPALAGETGAGDGVNSFISAAPPCPTGTAHGHRVGRPHSAVCRSPLPGSRHAGNVYGRVARRCRAVRHAILAGNCTTFAGLPLTTASKWFPARPSRPDSASWRRCCGLTGKAGATVQPLPAAPPVTGGLGSGRGVLDPKTVALSLPYDIGCLAKTPGGPRAAPIAQTFWGCA